MRNEQVARRGSRCPAIRLRDDACSPCLRRFMLDDGDHHSREGRVRRQGLQWHAGVVATPFIPIEIETDRLVLRRRSAPDATVQRELWTERDPRVPPHRRIGPDGRPTVEDIAASLRTEQEHPKTGLLMIVRKHEGDVIGYCGLIFDGRGLSDEPELAYELLRRAQGFGYATEAAHAVLEWAAQAGYRQVWAGVRRWNAASLRVLQKLAFVDTGQDEPDRDYGNSMVATRTFPNSDL